MTRKKKNVLQSGENYSISIPIYNDFPLIKIQQDYSRIIHRDIDFLLDSKAALKRKELPRKQSKVLDRCFSNPGFTIEAGYADFVKQSSNNWILRIDSDEIINRSAISFLEKFQLQSDHVIGFQRHQVIYKSGEFKIITEDTFNSEKHIQWRFFNRSFGTFGTNSIHNPGFELNERKLIYAPPECAIYHLDFVVRDLAQRVKKMNGYNLLGQPSSMQIIQLGIQDEEQCAVIQDGEILQFLQKTKFQIVSVLK